MKSRSASCCPRTLLTFCSSVQHIVGVFGPTLRWVAPSGMGPGAALGSSEGARRSGRPTADALLDLVPRVGVLCVTGVSGEASSPVMRCTWKPATAGGGVAGAGCAAAAASRAASSDIAPGCAAGIADVGSIGSAAMFIYELGVAMTPDNVDLRKGSFEMLIFLTEGGVSAR